jgi:hypothetical protein
MGKRRNFEHQFSYDIIVESWDIYTTFNEYAYLRVFSDYPLEESYCIIINGRLEDSFSRKLKKGKITQIILHPTDYWYKRTSEKEKESIGSIALTRDKVFNKGKDILLAHIHMPEKSFDLIKSYLTHKASGEVSLVGTDLQKRKAEIYYICFDSRLNKYSTRA